MRKKVILLLLSLAITGIFMIVIGPSGKLDARILYTSLDARNYLTQLTSSERERYLISEILDFWLIASYVSLFFVCLKHFHPDRPWIKWMALPGGMLDLLETSLIVVFILSGNWFESHHWLPVLSFLKWIFVSVTSFYVIVRKWCMA